MKIKTTIIDVVYVDDRFSRLKSQPAIVEWMVKPIGKFNPDVSFDRHRHCPYICCKPTVDRVVSEKSKSIKIRRKRHNKIKREIEEGRFSEEIKSKVLPDTQAIIRIQSTDGDDEEIFEICDIHFIGSKSFSDPISLDPSGSDVTYWASFRINAINTMHDDHSECPVIIINCGNNTRIQNKIDDELDGMMKSIKRQATERGFDFVSEKTSTLDLINSVLYNTPEFIRNRAHFQKNLPIEVPDINILGSTGTHFYNTRLNPRVQFT